MAVSPGNFGVTDFTFPAFAVAAASDVRDGVETGETIGTLIVPLASQVLDGIFVDAGVGTLKLPAESVVLEGEVYGVGGNGSTGSLDVDEGTSGGYIING